MAVLVMLMSATMKFSQGEPVVEMFVAKFGYPQNLLVVLGDVELACVILYAIPYTAILGAVLLTAYLGGAVATHVRVGDLFVGPVIVGVVAWVGIFLRDERLRAILPFRRPLCVSGPGARGQDDGRVGVERIRS